MNTIERVLPPVEYSSLEIISYSSLPVEDESFDKRISIAVVNENKDVIAKIIAEPIGHSSHKNNGGHIQEIEYPSNLKDFMIEEVLPKFSEAVKFTGRMVGHFIFLDYWFICFEANDPSCILKDYYKDADLIDDTYIISWENKK
jgi:hypothetical protein